MLDGNGQPVKNKNNVAITTNIQDAPGFNHAYTYAGYRYDKETGLYFLNARYYAPEIGRFLTKDTWKGTATDPGTLNRYTYTHGDPVNYIDTNGHRPDVTGGPESVAVYNSVSEESYKPVIQTGYSSSSQDNGVNNANKLLLGTVGAIVDAEIGKIATGTAKNALSRVGPVGALFVSADIAGDYVKYTDYNRVFAIGLTLVGVAAAVAITAAVIPVGASAMTTAFVALAVGVPIGMGIDWTKRKLIGY